MKKGLHLTSRPLGRGVATGEKVEEARVCPKQGREMDGLEVARRWCVTTRDGNPQSTKECNLDS